MSLCSFCKHYRAITVVSDFPAWAQEEHGAAYDGSGYDMNDEPWGQCRRNAPVASADAKAMWPVMFYEDSCGAFERRQSGGSNG